MNNEDKSQNLRSLKAEYREQGKAQRGYRTLKALINKKDDEGIAWLLRNHTEEAVYEKELIQRFEIDSLIEFYNLAFIGIQAGYIPENFNKELHDEIIEILGQIYVKPYYKDYYPYFLSRVVLRYTEKGRYNQIAESDLAKNIYFSFLSQVKIIRNDKDIERFMGVLDHVTYEGEYDLQDLLDSLKEPKTLASVLRRKQRKDELDRAIWGFIKYTGLLGEFSFLLDQSEPFPLFQSAMWHYHGYYFDRLNKTMNKFFTKAFASLGVAIVSNIEVNYEFKELDEEERVFFSAENQRKKAIETLNKTQSNVLKVLNPKYKISIVDYYNNLGPLIKQPQF
jgi:hypothetical protein